MHLRPRHLGVLDDGRRQQGVPVTIAPTNESTWRFVVTNLRADGPARGTLSVVWLA